MNGSKALAALAAAGIEADASTGTRARYSTDAGLYRIPPEVVVFPRDTDQVLRALEIARGFGIPITTRGGGTSCAGNSIGPGAVIDFSRHMNRVLSIDPRAQTATVEPGCIGSTLQEAARAHGLRFGPDPSSQNRASFGGMIGNNACGPHATAWGRTSDNIVSMECVDGRGRRFTASSRHGSAIPEVPGWQHSSAPTWLPSAANWGPSGARCPATPWSTSRPRGAATSQRCSRAPRGRWSRCCP